MTDVNGPDPELFPGVGYDYASVVSPGRLVFTAGACPLDSDGAVVSLGDHAGQAAVALRNLRTALRSYGAEFHDVVRTTIYVVGDRDDLVQVWNVVAGGLAPHRPPSTLVGVSVLGYPGQLVEIDAVAATAP